ncbi:MAG: hypothetical protein ACFFAO_15780 [Candidatus Hermodarchaeota archaeon]
MSEIIEDHPKILWRKFNHFSGIEESEFFNYFKECKKGLAIKITEIKFFKTPLDPKSLIPNFVAPQSFCYIDDLELNNNILTFT